MRRPANAPRLSLLPPRARRPDARPRSDLSRPASAHAVLFRRLSHPRAPELTRAFEASFNDSRVLERDVWALPLHLARGRLYPDVDWVDSNALSEELEHCTVRGDQRPEEPRRAAGLGPAGVRRRRRRVQAAAVRSALSPVEPDEAVAPLAAAAEDAAGDAAEAALFRGRVLAAASALEAAPGATRFRLPRLRWAQDEWEAYRVWAVCPPPDRGELARYGWFADVF